VDLIEYRELMAQWQSRVKERNILFKSLVDKCKNRTDLRMETAKQLGTKLARDLDPSILMIQIKVHPMEDRDTFKEWLTEHIGPYISRYKDNRISAIIDKEVMPKEVRDSLLVKLSKAPLYSLWTRKKPAMEVLIRYWLMISLTNVQGK